MPPRLQSPRPQWAELPPQIVPSARTVAWIRWSTRVIGTACFGYVALVYVGALVHAGLFPRQGVPYAVAVGVATVALRSAFEAYLTGRRRRAVLPLAVAAALLLGLTHAVSGIVAATAAVAIEAIAFAILLTVAYGTARGRAGSWTQTLKSALEDWLPDTFARFMAVEAAIVLTALRVPLRLESADVSAARGFSYVTGSTLHLMVMVFGIALIPELFLVDILLFRQPLLVRLAVDAAAVYGFVWLLGWTRSMTLLPHRVGARSLHLRNGVIRELVVPVTDLLAIEPKPAKKRWFWQRMRTSDRSTSWSVDGVPAVKLSFKTPQRALGAFGSGPPIDSITVSVDDVRGFRAAVEHARDTAGASPAPFSDPARDALRESPAVA
jgi:hypothetical protein